MRFFQILTVSTLLSIFALSPAFAAFKGPGGVPEVKTAVLVAQAMDDTPCILEGYIVARLTPYDDKYTFKDDTGTVVVEIDDELFYGRDITPQHKVRIAGEVDGETFRTNQVDVEWMEIIK